MRKWTPLTAVCLGTLMLLVDVTIVNVALPDIAGDLSASFADLQWVIDIYALVLAALLLATGSLADAWGRRRIYVYGLVIFAVSSLVCGVAQNSTELVIARGVQGVGGAAMFATTVALLNMSYQGRDRGIAYGVWGAVSGAAAGFGVVIGGLLVDWASWRWIFFVNLPISVAAIAMSVIVFRDEARQRVHLDIAGMLTFVLAAGSTTYGMIRAGEYGWTDPGTVVALVGGVVSFAAFTLIELRSAAPLINLHLFKRPSFVGFNLAAAALSFAAFGYFALLSIWLQTVYGMSAIQAGLAFLPLTITAFVVSGATGRVLNGAPPRWPIGGGILLIGVGALSMRLLDVGGSWTWLLPGEIITGIGVGIVSPIVAAAALGSVPTAQGGMASGLVNTGRQLGLAFGVALLGTAFQSSAVRFLTDAGAPEASATAQGMAAGGTQAIVASVPAESRTVAEQTIQAAFVDGLDVVFLVAGLAGLLAGAACLLLIRGRQAAGVPDEPASTGKPARAGSYVGRHRAPAGFAIDTRDDEPAPDRRPVQAQAIATATPVGGRHFANAARLEPDTVDAP